MPTIEENYHEWNSAHAWNDREEEWSSSYPGGSRTMWYGLIYPRIHYFLPAETILEIAPGMGRWTQYLKDYCEQLLIVDLSDKCINACKKHFFDASHIEYHVNDGRSLDMISDESVDFVFSFDSLVHCEADVVESYLTQLATKLKPNGVGFFHHSNLKNYSTMLRYVPDRISRYFGYRSAWRARSVSADLFGKLCDKAGLCCMSQELVNWDTSGLFLIDAFSVFSRGGSAAHSRNVVVKNREYMNECFHIMKLAGAVHRPVAP